MTTLSIHRVRSFTVETAKRLSTGTYCRALVIETDEGRFAIELYADHLSVTLPRSQVDMEAETAMVLGQPEEIDLIDVETAA